MTFARKISAGVFSVLALVAVISLSQEQPLKRPGNTGPEQEVRDVLKQIQAAAEALDAEKVFSYVLPNDSGALAQNGKLYLTREEARDSTKAGFEGLQKVSYRFEQQHVTMLSPSVALAVGLGSSSATLQDGRTFTSPFAQSVILVLTNGQWRVFHAHRSVPSNR